MDMLFDYDSVIIGGGPAGISAAVNLKLQGKNAGIFSNDYRDSGLFKAKRIDNFPGLFGFSGEQFLIRLYEHADAMGLSVNNSQVLSVSAFKKGFYISAGEMVCSARTVIIATGAVQSAFYPGEAKLLGHGVSYCATCDGMLYRGKNTLVVGLRSGAVHEANQLYEIGCNVSYIETGIGCEGLRPEIPVLHGKEIEFVGEEILCAVRLGGNEVPADAAFVVRSSVAPSLLMPGLDVNEGFIGTTGRLETNIPGVFAAGDCTGKPHQIARAAGQGQIAAFSASEYIRKGNFNG